MPYHYIFFFNYLVNTKIIALRRIVTLAYFNRYAIYQGIFICAPKELALRLFFSLKKLPSRKRNYLGQRPNHVVYTEIDMLIS